MQNEQSPQSGTSVQFKVFSVVLDLQNSVVRSKTARGYWFLPEELELILSCVENTLEMYSEDGTTVEGITGLRDMMDRRIADLRFSQEDFKSKPKITYIYLVLDQTSNLTKIGRSMRPKNRFSSLKVGTPGELLFLGAYKGEAHEEALLHAKYASCRVTGEWFKLQESDLIEIRHYFRDREVIR